MTTFSDVTWLSVVPSLVTITLAFTTRQVILSLFSGILAGGLVLFLQTGSFSEANIINAFLIPAMGSDTYAIILLIYLWCLGGILGLWGKTGGAERFARFLGEKIVKGPRSALLFTWLVGLTFHQGGTISTILTGTTSKPVADRHGVSHEELAYVVDSTASPVVTLIPFNAWPIYVTALIVGTIPFLPDRSHAYKMYLTSIPFNFYSLSAVTITFLFAMGWLPWVGQSMKEAKARARTAGQLDKSESEPLIQTKIQDVCVPEGYTPSMIDFFVPIGLLLSITVFPFMFWKLGFIAERYANCTNEAFMTALLSSIVLAKLRGMSLHDILDALMTGCKEMTIGAMIIGMAITLGYVTKELRTADFFVQLLAQDTPMFLLPVVLMLLCMVMSFSTGTSLGTYAVVFPIALPLAYAINPNLLYMHVCFGAVLGGAVFGDQCSPISDTTIFSSMFTGCDLMDHVRTQFPLALAAAGCGALISTLVLLFANFN